MNLADFSEFCLTKVKELRPQSSHVYSCAETAEAVEMLKMSGFDVDLALNQRLDNMLDMIKRLGIGPVPSDQAAAELVLASAVRVCEACPKGEICRDWLVRAAPTLYKAPPFCPNADHFARLLAVEMMTYRGKADTTH